MHQENCAGLCLWLACDQKKNLRTFSLSIRWHSWLLQHEFVHWQDTQRKSAITCSWALTKYQLMLLKSIWWPQSPERLVTALCYSKWPAHTPPLHTVFRLKNKKESEFNTSLLRNPRLQNSQRCQCSRRSFVFLGMCRGSEWRCFCGPQTTSE